MRYVAAYLLFALSGSAPTEDDIKRVLESVGIECDTSRATQVVKAMAGKKVDSVIAEGMTKMASVPSGGGGAPAAGGAASEAPAGGAPAKEEEKKPEPVSESDDDMGFGLFD